jgi:hypothetical protein
MPTLIFVLVWNLGQYQTRNVLGNDLRFLWILNPSISGTKSHIYIIRVRSGSCGWHGAPVTPIFSA